MRNSGLNLSIVALIMMMMLIGGSYEVTEPAFEQTYHNGNYEKCQIFLPRGEVYLITSATEVKCVRCIPGMIPTLQLIPAKLIGYDIEIDATLSPATKTDPFLNVTYDTTNPDDMAELYKAGKLSESHEEIKTDRNIESMGEGTRAKLSEVLTPKTEGENPPTMAILSQITVDGNRCTSKTVQEAEDEQIARPFKMKANSMFSHEYHGKHTTCKKAYLYRLVSGFMIGLIILAFAY